MIQEVSLGVAFGAGFLSFFAPCILPLIPSYLAWISGLSLSEDSDRGEARKKLFLNSLLLILGFSIVFVVLGASASFLGKFLAPHRLLVQRIGGLLIIIFGLEFIGFLKIFKNHRLGLVRNLFFKINRGTSSFFVGLTFAFAWVACFSPILGSILVFSSFQETLNQGIMLLIFYSLGLAVPFLFSSLFLSLVMDRIRIWTKISRWISFSSGFILVVLGFLLFSDNFYKVVAWLTKILE